MKPTSLIILLVIALASCSNTQVNDTVEDEPTPVFDSVFVEPPLEPFPDTMYESAEKLMYVIDTMAFDISPEIVELADPYEGKEGIFTFRGSQTRNPYFFGRLHGDSIDIQVEWAFETHCDNDKTILGVWGGGSGWTGQPLYLPWPDSLLSKIDTAAAHLSHDFSGKEIVVSSLSSREYLIDFETGAPSRDCFSVGNTLKGTPSFDPSFSGLLFVGHAVPKRNPFGMSVFNLYQHNEVVAYGRDSKAWRSWNGNDSSPVKAGDFMFRPSENGILYKYYVGDGNCTLHSTLRYSTSKAKSSPGIESSMAVCRNYGYLADNYGNIICVNLNTLKPVWHYDNHDDTDASPVAAIENDIPYLYTGCEVDKQGFSGYSYFVKLNGLTGELVWEQKIPCQKIKFGEKSLDGGMFSTPLLGANDCDSLIFNGFCINKAGNLGAFYAFNRNDGHIVYETKIADRCWSSPVPFYNENDEMFIFLGDTRGSVYLLKAVTGEILATKKIGNNFESSPIIVDDKIILGTRGNKIYKITLQ